MSDYGLSQEMPDDTRQEKWKKQRETRGFDETELWSLDIAFAKMIVERLENKKFFNIVERLENKKLLKIFNKIIEVDAAYYKLKKEEFEELKSAVLEFMEKYLDDYYIKLFLPRLKKYEEYEGRISELIEGLENFPKNKQKTTRLFSDLYFSLWI
jgi:hypothetical protein